MKRMKVKVITGLMAAVMIASSLPMGSAFAQEAEPVETAGTAVEATIVEETPAETPAVVVEETPAVVVEETPAAAVAEEPAAEAAAVEETPAAAVAEEPVAQAAAVVEEAPAEAIVEEAPIVRVTPAATISVIYHFYAMNASGEYVEVKTMNRSVRTGGTTTNISGNNIANFGSYTHTFRDPSIATPVEHYEFLRWENAADASETYTAGGKFTISSSELSGDLTQVQFNAVWQPSVTVQYNVPGTLAESEEEYVQVRSEESFESISVYGFEPEYEGAEFIGWYDEAGNLLSEEAAYEAPEETITRIEQKIENVYAQFETSYTIEHYTEAEDGSYTLEETETVEHVLIGTEVEAEAIEIEGFTFNEGSEDNITSATVVVGTTLKLYYTRNAEEVIEVIPVVDPEPTEEVDPEPAAPAEEPAAEETVVEGPAAEEPAAEPEAEMTEEPAAETETTEAPAAVPAAPVAAASAEASEEEPVVIYEAEVPTAERTMIRNAEVPAAAPEAIEEAIDEADIPAAAPAEANGRGAWALMNLVAAIGTAVIALALLVGYFGKKKNEKDEAEARENDEAKTKRHGIVRVLSIIPAIAGIAAFILTEDMTQRMILIDRWTILMIIILAVNVILAILAKKKKEDRGEEGQVLEGTPEAC